MPVFEYKCKSCETKYEIFHSIKENIDEVICPDCKSKESEKLFSTFTASVSSSNSPIPSSCQNCCNGPACGFN